VSGLYEVRASGTLRGISRARYEVGETPSRATRTKTARCSDEEQPWGVTSRLASANIANIHCHCHCHCHCYNTQYRDGKTFPPSSIISRRSYNSVGRPVAIRSSQLASLCAAYVNTAPCQSILGLTYIRPSQPAAQPQEQQPHNNPHSGPDLPLLRYRAVRPWCRPQRSIPSPKSASWRPGRSGQLHPAIHALPICTSQT
jgi:hypothetical protein